MLRLVSVEGVAPPAAVSGTGGVGSRRPSGADRHSSSHASSSVHNGGGGSVHVLPRSSPRWSSALLHIVRAMHDAHSLLPVVLGALAALLALLSSWGCTPATHPMQQLHLSRATARFAHTLLHPPHTQSHLLGAHLASANVPISALQTSHRAISAAYATRSWMPRPSESSEGSGTDSRTTVGKPSERGWRAAHRWSVLTDRGLAHAPPPAGLGAEVVRDYSAFPSPLPAPLMLPPAAPSASLSVSGGLPAPHVSERLLVLYVFSATNDEYIVNLRWFIRRAVRAHHNADYVFLINQVEGRVIDLASLPSLPPNARYIQHRNECYDWGTIGWILDLQDEIDRDTLVGTTPTSSYWLNLRAYTHFIIMNSSVRGPWFPSYVDLDDPRNVWYAPLMRQLRSAGQGVRMAGPVVSCEVHTHLQSYVLLTDVEGLRTLRFPDPRRSKGGMFPSPRLRVNNYGQLGNMRVAARSNSRVAGAAHQCPGEPSTHNILDLGGSGVFGCHSALEQAIVEAELGASRIMIEHGWNLGSLTRLYSGVDFRVSTNQRCFEFFGNPSDTVLQGERIRHGAYSPAGLAAQRIEAAARGEEDAQRAAEKEYREAIMRAATLAESHGKHAHSGQTADVLHAVGALLPALMNALPDTKKDAEDETPPLLEGDPSTLPDMLRSLRAQTLRSPAPLSPHFSPSGDYALTRAAAQEAEPIWIDPLEVLFSKYKSHIKFPPKHVERYFQYEQRAKARAMQRYVAEHVQPAQRAREQAMQEAAHRWQGAEARERLREEWRLMRLQPSLVAPPQALEQRMSAALTGELQQLPASMQRFDSATIGPVQTPPPRVAQQRERAGDQRAAAAVKPALRSKPRAAWPRPTANKKP